MSVSFVGRPRWPPSPGCRSWTSVLDTRGESSPRLARTVARASNGPATAVAAVELRAAMRVPDRCLADLRQRGYLVFEGFLEADELEAAQEGLWLHYPRPEEYFADPAAHAWLATDQWAGIVGGPWRSWSLNRLAFHPDLLDLAERFLGSADLRLYEAELWAKYAGAVDYDQRHHRDFANHSLVAPKRSQPATQMLSWILLSDVGEEDGPTKVVPLSGDETVSGPAGMMVFRDMGLCWETRMGRPF
jgi:Phytanoyl-CoA dioxygenase (PhyH)